MPDEIGPAIGRGITAGLRVHRGGCSAKRAGVKYRAARAGSCWGEVQQAPTDSKTVPQIGWGARIRTWEWRYQKPLPYRLATPQQSRAL